MHKATRIFLPTLLFVGLFSAQLWVGEGVYGQRGKKKKDKDQTTTTRFKPSDKSKVDYLFIEASTEYVKGNSEEAREMFKQVLEIDSKHHASMYNLAKIHFEAGEYKEAVKYAEEALELNPENYWYYSQLSDIYESAHDLKSAIKVQERMVERFPEDIDALFDLAQFYIGDNDYEKSVAVYDRIEAQIGMNEDVVFRKHQLYLYLNRPEEALAEIEKLISFFPNDQRYYQAQYDLLMMSGREKEAIQTLEQLLETNPNDAFALLALADYYKSEGDFKKSDTFLFRAFDNDQVDLESKVKILSALYPYAERDPEVRQRMEELGSRLYASHPESALVNGVRADIFQAAGQQDSARAYYRKSLDIDPSNQQVWQELLFIDSENGDYAALEKDAEEALEYFPNQTLFLYFFGVGSAENDHADEAIYAFEKIKKVGSSSANGNQELLMQAYLSLGDLYNELEEFDKSDENFEAALEIDDDNPLILNNYAYFLSLRNEQLDKAAKMVQKALEVSPGQSAYQDTYGWILYQQGDLKGAEEWIKKAIDNGGQGEVYEHYGDVLFKQGQVETARKYWEKASETGTPVDIDRKLKAAGN